jgi:hypothetical protein
LDVQEVTSGDTGKHHWNKERRLKTAITSGKQDDIRQDLREKTIGLEIVKRTVRFSVRIRKTSNRTL